MSDELILGDLAFESRLLIGTGKYSDVEVEREQKMQREPIESVEDELMESFSLLCTFYSLLSGK